MLEHDGTSLSHQPLCFTNEEAGVEEMPFLKGSWFLFCFVSSYFVLVLASFFWPWNGDHDPDCNFLDGHRRSPDSPMGGSCAMYNPSLFSYFPPELALCSAKAQNFHLHLPFFPPFSTEIQAPAGSCSLLCPPPTLWEGCLPARLLSF